MIDNPPSEFSATTYGRKITINLDHSDLDIEELLEVFKSLAVALGYSEESWNNHIQE